MGREVPFIKMQAVGNDFVLIDGRAHPRERWPYLAIHICDRHTGIGADGLLVIDHSRSADVLMRMFNPDGTPDVCGNGMRCVARFVAEHGMSHEDAAPIVPPPNHATTLDIETLSGIRHARVVPNSGGVHWTVDMGEPKFHPSQIPMDVDSTRVMGFPLEVLGERIEVTALSTGTTHTVVFVSGLPHDERFSCLSPAIENHRLFPERTSVIWTQVMDADGLQLRIWERGAGETWGCGTGACAAAAAAILHGFARSPVRVQSRGGELSVQWEEAGAILLTGPAEYVYRGIWPAV